MLSFMSSGGYFLSRKMWATWRENSEGLRIVRNPEYMTYQKTLKSFKFFREKKLKDDLEITKKLLQK